MNKNKWYCNVVYYDNVDAYVEKFVMPLKEDGELDPHDMALLRDFLTEHGEVLKVDPLYQLDNEEFIAFHDHGNGDQKQAFERYLRMYL